MAARHSNAHWSIDETSRLLTAARIAPGKIDDVEASLWWPALLLAILDTHCSLQGLVKAKYDGKRKHLKVGPLVYALHDRTAAALDCLLETRRRPDVLHWSIRNRNSCLASRFCTVARLAGVPYRPLKNTLRATARRFPSILDALDDAVALPQPELPTYRKGWRKPEPWPFPLVERSLVRFFDDVYRPVRLGRSPKHTIEDYRRSVREFATFLGRDSSLDDLTEMAVEDFMASLPHLAPETINGHRRNLLAIWRMAWRRRQLAEPPREVMKLVEPKHARQAWTVEEVGRIIAASRRERGSAFGIPLREWWPALLYLLYDTGLRIGAAMQLPRGSFQADGWLIVPHSIQKHKADQPLKLSQETISAVSIVLAKSRESNWLLPHVYETKTLQNHLRRILERAGLPAGRLDLFHKLRRTSATLVADALGEEAARKHLGHSALWVTRRYLDYQKIRVEQPIDHIPRPPAVDDVA